LTGTLEAYGKARVLHLLREEAVEIGRLHGFVLSPSDLDKGSR
jgi:hypothetical protein